MSNKCEKLLSPRVKNIVIYIVNLIHFWQGCCSKIKDYLVAKQCYIASYWIWATVFFLLFRGSFIRWIHSPEQNHILTPYTNRLNMQLIQSIYSNGGTRGHIKTPLRGTKSIRKTQFGFEKNISSLMFLCCSLWMCVCVCVYTPVWWFVSVCGSAGVGQTV